MIPSSQPGSPVKQTSRDVVVDVDHLHKSYMRGGVATPVLQGVSLQVEAGQCVFLSGPSGSGKTTLLSILGCILRPDQGRIELLGQDLMRLNDRQRIAMRRDRIGFVFQKFHLIHGLTAAENVAVSLTLQGVPNADAQSRSREILTEVGLADHVDANPIKMSNGQCQRVALARALAVNPDIILADEPTASLDEANGRTVMEMLSRLINEKHKTAIVVTHDPRIYCFADRVYRMEEGCIVDETSHSSSPSTQSSASMLARTTPVTGINMTRVTE